MREKEEDFWRLKGRERDSPGGAVDRSPLANVGDMGSIPDPGRFHMPQSIKSTCHNC